MRGVALLAGATWIAGAQGAGFAIIEHSAQGLGTAFSGGAASAADGSTVYFNPAGMSRLEGTQVHAAGHVIITSFDFTDTGSFQATPAGNLPLLPTASRSDDGGTIGLVPNLYYVRDLAPGWKFGLGVNAPFGLRTEYGRNWVGRYQAVESDILSINVNPSLSFKVSDDLSFGFGVNAMYLRAKLSNAIDFDAVCRGSVAPAVVAGSGLVPPPAIPATVAATCTGLPGSGSSEGFVENEADDWGFGINAGLLYQVTPTTRVGIAYRSEVHHELEGDANFTVPAGIAAGAFGPATQGTIATLFADTSARANLDLPASLSASLHQRIGDKFTLLADATWTGWSSVQELRIDFGTPGQPDGVETLGWDDTWRLSLGLEYAHNDRLTLRTGVAWDESPIPNAAARTARLPDNDRVWLAFGASYRVSDRLSADFGYVHLFVDDTDIQRTGSTGSVLRGTYDSQADILSAQVRYRFK